MRKEIDLIKMDTTPALVIVGIMILITVIGVILWINRSKEI